MILLRVLRAFSVRSVFLWMLFLERQEPGGVEVVLFFEGIGDAVPADAAASTGGVYELVIADREADGGALPAFRAEE